MATRYWVPSGGVSTGTWDASTTTNWSATSGGAGGASAPTLNDDVFFDANSDAGGIFTVTIGAGAVCRDITISGLDQVMTLAGSAAWSIYGSLAFPATNLSSTYSGNVSFLSTTTGKTITTNGVVLTSGACQFLGAGGEWILGSALTVGVLRLFNGNFDVSTSNYSVTVYTTLEKTSGTINARAGTISFINSTTNFLGGGVTYYNVSFTNTASGSCTITGANTFNNLTFTSLAATGIRNIALGANQTVNGTLTLGTANTAIRRLFMRSDTIGTPRTITAAAIATLADVDFRDIVAAGASGTWSGTRLGNCLGNSNITFDAGKTVYWNLAGARNWSSTAWALTNTGIPDVNNFPLAQDTAVFTEAGSAGTVTIDTTWNLGNITFSDGVSNRTSAMTLNTFTRNYELYGDLILFSNIVLTGTGVFNFIKQGATQNINTVGVLFDFAITKNGGGTLQLNGTLTMGASRPLTHTAGTIDLNDFDLTTGLYSSTGSTARQLDVGTGTFTNSGATFTVSGSNYTTAGTGSISMTSASSKTFAGGGFSYPALNQGGAGTLNVTGANTFADITNTAQPCTVIFPANTITNVYDFNLSGTAGNLVTIQSSIAGQRFTLNKVEP